MMHLNAKDRNELDELWLEAWTSSDEPAAVAVAALDLLSDAEQAGRRWAAQQLEAAVLGGLTGMAKKWRKAREPKALVAYNGKVVGSTNTAFSVIHRDAKSGATSHALHLFVEMSWADIEALIEDANRRIGAAVVTRTAGVKLLGLRVLHPNTYGPAQAAAAEGMTVDEFLGSEERAAS